MSATDGAWWMLGFSYDAVIDAWQDARFADAVERAWRSAGSPPAVEVHWLASADDDFAFRFYVNDAAASLLDAAGVTWRTFVVGRIAALPPGTRPFVPGAPPAES